VRIRKALFHVDGVQAVGRSNRLRRIRKVDLFALSGHKLHAPQGIGALYMRNGVSLPSWIIGGGQGAGTSCGNVGRSQHCRLGAACRLAHEG
jgi:cysteine desulfurase